MIAGREIQGVESKKKMFIEVPSTSEESSTFGVFILVFLFSLHFLFIHSLTFFIDGLTVFSNFNINNSDFSRFLFKMFVSSFSLQCHIFSQKFFTFSASKALSAFRLVKIHCRWCGGKEEESDRKGRPYD